MINVTPTCRFCQRKLTECDDFTQTGGVPLYRYKCTPCKSTQFFESDGKPDVYWFIVGKYMLHFSPRQNVFSIRPDNNKNGVFVGDVITLDYLPTNLTPQNTTEERIKTLLVFS